MMSQKRQSEEDGEARSEGTSSDDKRRRVPKLKSVFLEWMKIQSLQNSLEPVLEPLIRRVVKEEVELALSKHLTCMKCKEVISPELRIQNLQLQFTKGLSLPLFTGARIEGEESSTLQIALFDSLTVKIVDSGPESSARVEVVVLEGDFDGGNWMPEEFKSNIVKEREGKKPLLTGDAFLSLKDGVGSVGDVSFTDNSSWTRSRRFRLGARVVDSVDGTSVKEAKTEPFIVRDHRGELYKKHHPPSLVDEVWRLEKIGKDGAFHKRLVRENISTVKDFLTMLFVDSSRLRNILGTGMSAKMWEVAVDHARTCVLDQKIYLFHPPASKNGVVFNIVGQLMGLLSECQFVSHDKLLETEKVEAQNQITCAFGRWDEVVSFDNEASLTSSSPNLTVIPHDTPSSGSPKFSPSPDMISSIYSISSLDDFSFHGIDNLRYDQTLSFPGPNSMICDTESMSQAFCEDDEHLQYFDANAPHDEAQGNAAENAIPGRSEHRAKRRWRKIISVMRWFSLKRELDSKKKVTRR